MSPVPQRHLPWAHVAVPALAGFCLAGCASPGAPKPPSLHLPAVVRSLSAERSGDTVQLRFPRPDESTDGQPLPAMQLTWVICRQDAPGSPCKPLSAPQTASTTGPQVDLQFQDDLPPFLHTGAPRLLFYQVEIRNGQGRSAGFSAPTPAAGGAAPPPVEGLRAQGVRTGVLLQWTPRPGAGEVLLRREQIDPPPAASASPKHPTPSAVAKEQKKHGQPVPPSSLRVRAPSPEGTVWLQAEPGALGAKDTIDGTVTDATRYRYTAVRRVAVRTGGASLEMRSAPSAPLLVTWNDVYPPAAPEGLTAVGFRGAATDHPYAVDLIWQPVNDLRVTGYLVWRTRLQPGGPAGEREQLTSTPIPTPAFHDTTAQPTATYLYEVAATDARRNQGPTTKTTLQAQTP